ncbi:hypothetical protein OUS_0285 [Helicobacter pylori R056a]|uniref:Uncharacterized protein n=1 Tax=Helicobacter pylori R018c TaxID=1145110 RepID=K2KGN7_HELPX|nr:hypothetical protein OUC_0199 [Helicobacter pylori R018c]EKE96216.1 hypothetical protein OUS_0285 [Helicobacter pylori R056a]
MELLRIIFHAFFNGFFGLTFSKGIILNKQNLQKGLLITPLFSNPYIFKLMKLYINRLNNPYSYIISFVFMA